MDTVHIDWDETVIRFKNVKDSKRPKLDKKGFYAILGAVFNTKTKKWGTLKLLYIGQAFDQNLRERVPQEHPAYECVFNYQKKHSSVDIVVMLGTIKKSTVQKSTQQLFNDIECCLILCNQPLCNTSCKDSYSGRDLKVINAGHPFPLKKECSCSETKEK